MRTYYQATIFATILSLSGTLFGQGNSLDTARLSAIGTAVNDAMQNAQYPKAAALLKEMISLGMNNSETYFGAAAAIGLSGDTRSAVAYLDSAAAKGWSDMNAWRMMTGSFHVEDDPLIAEATDRVKSNAALITSAPPTNSEMHTIFLADQKDRLDLIAAGQTDNPTPEKARILLHSDSMRRAQTYGLVNAKRLHAALDYYEAAIVLQHGTDTTDFRTAHELALVAISLGNEDAKWLAAATLDHYLIKQRKPQKYGTQSFTNKRTGKRELYPVDPNVTDEERAKWNVLPLANALKLVEKEYDSK